MKAFLDSNVFLYAFLNQDVGKKSVAARILADAVVICPPGFKVVSM